VRRVTWFTAGAVTGVYAILKARNTARNFTPDGIAARASALAVGLRAFRSEVATGMAEREAELRAQLAQPPPGLRAVVPALIERSNGKEPAFAREGYEDRTDGHR
jgi:uncharacterized protein DUF6167